MHFVGAKQVHSQIGLLFLKKVEVEIKLTSVSDSAYCVLVFYTFLTHISTLPIDHRLDIAMTTLFDTDDECS